MAIDTTLVLLALLSFGALVASWVAAPLHGDESVPSAAAGEPAFVDA
jgi:hypothetical protein